MQKMKSTALLTIVLFLSGSISTIEVSTIFKVESIINDSYAPTCDYNIHLLNNHRKYAKSRLQYYHNGSATFQLILDGDIELNPGPVSTDSCCKCKRFIRLDHRRSSCTLCLKPLHLKCAAIPASLLRHHGLPVPESLCPECAACELPFADVSLSSSRVSYTSDSNSPDDSFVSNAGTSMLLLNAGSISNKIDELTCIMYSMDPKPAIVAITESWLNSNISVSGLSMNNEYHVFRNDRPSRGGGGVCLLVHDSLKPHLCNDLTSTSTND